MRLHVERRGAGRDLVLLHGWAMHSGVWQESLERLAARHRVHAIDLPGHGNSANVAPSSFDDAVASVAEAIPDGAIVCGWSLGGLFAQQLARSDRAKAGALALVGTTPSFVRRPDWPHAMEASTLEAFGEGLHRDRDTTLREFVKLNALNGSRGREAIRTFTTRLGAAPGSQALAASLRWLREVDLRDGASAIDVPTVVMHGARDALAPAAAGRWLAATIPGARLFELPDAAHLPFFTHTDAFVRCLESIR
jgi:pimeloyl-[acyl-carrier protein] methyl ester esterase